MIRAVASALVFALGMSWAAPAARAEDARLSGGFNVRVASGTFGSNQTTTIVYAPAVVRLDVNRLEFAGFFPYLSIHDATGAPSDGGWVPMQGTVNGSPNVGMMSGGMMGSSGTTSGTSSLAPVGLSSPSGFGDVVASAGYRVVDRSLSGLQVVVSGRVKVPTASYGQGLGTGRADIAATAGVRKRFDSGWVYGEAGYLVVGKVAGAGLRNAVLWNMGAARRISTRVFLLASAYGNSAVVPGYASPLEVGAGLGFRLAEHLNLTMVPSAGLSNASPKYAVTFGLSTDLLRR